MPYRYLLLFGLQLFCKTLYAQAPQKVWDKTIGGNNYDNASSIVATSDGGFVVVGTSNSGISGDKTEANKGSYDYWITRLSSTGQKVWDKTIGGSGADYAYSIVATSDGGFVIAGSSDSGISGDKTEANKIYDDYWIVKINSTGQKVWDKTIGGSGTDYGPLITATSDGGFVIAGISNSGISGDKTEDSGGFNDYWIVKLNNTGQKVWDKTIGGNNSEFPSSITSTSDGGFIISGSSNSGISRDKTEASRGFYDFWIVKLNSTGQKLWDKTIGGNNFERPNSITPTSDGGFVVAGTSDSDVSGDKTEANKGSYDYWIVKLSSTGQKLWNKTIGGNSYDDTPSIIVTFDNEFIIAGRSYSNISGDKTEESKGNTDYWIVRLNSTGQKVWDKTIGGNGYDYATSIVSTSDGGFVVTGYSDSGVSGDKTEASRGYSDYWIVKLSNSSACPACLTTFTQANFSTQAHFCAAQYLCTQTIIVPNQSQNPITTKIIRGDVAKIAYLGLVGRTAVTTAQNYPVPFLDLQAANATDTTYFKFAKVLSYLDYQDGRPAFDRNRSKFNPGDTITRSDMLKVLVEAWNIDEFAIDNAAPMPYADAGLATHPNYRYIKKAYELGIITGVAGSFFRPNTACTREEAFLMLYRLMTTTTISKPTLAHINAGFFVPGQYRPDNLNVGVGTDRGNFNHYTKTSFAMDGVVPLVFAHSYNSYATELPDELFPNFLGRGWTHSFNCYIVLSAATAIVATRRIVHYPDGKIHYYRQAPNGTDWICESIGVFDTMIDGSGFTEITTPGKLVYRFESVAGQPTTRVRLVRSIRDRNANTLLFTNELGVNNDPRLRSVADPAGRTMNFVYKTATNWLTEVNLSGVGTFNGRKITFDYNTLLLDGDGFPDLKEYKEPDLTGALKTTTYSYFTYADSTAHLLRAITLPKGNVVTNTYEKRKLRSSRTLNGTTVVQQMNTNWTSDYSPTAQNSRGTVSVTAGSTTKTTNYRHNSNGLATNVQTIGANPVELSMNYGLPLDPTSVTRISQKSSATDSTGVRVDYFPVAPYNVRFVKTAKAVGDSITQSYTYNSFNDILSFTNGRGFVTSFVYNTTGNMTQIAHPLGAPTTMVRDGRGLITQTTTPASVVTNFTYNSYGNLLSGSMPNGANPAIVTSATYDELSRVVSKTDARNQTVTYQYHANDLLRRMDAPLSYYVAYGYDANDNNTTVTNAKGNATTNTYDQNTDQLMSRSFGAKTESFTYHEDGSLRTFTNGRGTVFTFTYDASGRLTDDGYSAYAFNKNGTLNTVSHTQGAKSYVLDYDYDLLKRVNKSTCDGFAVQYRYDNNNNLDLITYPDGKTVAHAYDAKDRLVSVTDWAGRVTTYTYDNDGKVLTYTLPNTTRATYTYDAAGRSTGISHQKANNSVICSYGFALDQGGNHTEENIVESFTALPALTPGTTTYTNNARNETTAVGNTAYTFDGNGAMNNQAGQAITWDTKDNLVTRNGITYFYDGNETRRAKTGERYVINELSNSVLAETNDAGMYLYYYVYGPTGLLYRQNAITNAVEYYHYDFRGSTVAMTDASQNVVRQYQYDAYGRILQQTPAATSDDNPFRYVGQYGVQYEDASLYFMRARYYDPNTGKFLSEDPIWSTNLFAYGDNNPILNNDPSGLVTVQGTLSKINSTVDYIVTYSDPILSFSSDLLPENSIAGKVNGEFSDALVLYSFMKSAYQIGKCEDNVCTNKNVFDIGILMAGIKISAAYSSASGIGVVVYFGSIFAGDMNTLYHYGFEGENGLNENGSHIYKSGRWVGNKIEKSNDIASKIMLTPQWFAVKIIDHIKRKRR